MKVIKLKNKQSLIGIICICVLMCFFISGAALGSSDKGDDEHGSGGSKGWVATDTYRVMNFAVLAGALFFLLRKPVTHALDTRIKENKLHFIIYFRSWDLWNGFPANLGAIQLLKEYMASCIGVDDGEIIAASKGLHLYDYVWELAKLRTMSENPSALTAGRQHDED